MKVSREFFFFFLLQIYLSFLVAAALIEPDILWFLSCCSAGMWLLLAQWKTSEMWRYDSEVSELVEFHVWVLRFQPTAHSITSNAFVTAYPHHTPRSQDCSKHPLQGQQTVHRWAINKSSIVMKPNGCSSIFQKQAWDRWLQQRQHVLPPPEAETRIQHLYFQPHTCHSVFLPRGGVLGCVEITTITLQQVTA